MSIPTFAYPSKLASDGNEIRLLKPTKISKTRLDFQLVVRRRSSRPPGPPYTAISYTWGEESPTDVIYLDKRPFSVRPNLWACLYCICTSNERKDWHNLLWVDAVCINQFDDVEKSSQVSIMSKTYSDAKCVFAWIGLPQDMTVRSLKENNASLLGDLYRLCKIKLHLEPSHVANATLTPSGATWESEIDDLTNRQYWKRRWVVQEFLLAKNLYIFCGRASIHWHEFRILAHRHEMNLAANDDPRTNRVTSAALTLLDGKAFRKKPWRGTLYSLLKQYSKMECGDQRDRVFSLLGLASDVGHLRGVLPNYGISMDEVAVHIMVYRLRDIYEQGDPNQEIDADEDISEVDWTTMLLELGYRDFSVKQYDDFIGKAREEFKRRKEVGLLIKPKALQ